MGFPLLSSPKYLPNRILLVLLISSVLIASVFSAEKEGPEIEVLTPEIRCDRKTKLGDGVAVHYRGILASDGSQFDASYDRGKPLKFEVGKGSVIKGCVAARLTSKKLLFFAIMLLVVLELTTFYSWGWKAVTRPYGLSPKESLNDDVLFL